MRAGRVSADTFVVSFERVPLWQETPSPLAPTYTFQLILRADGTVQYRYGALVALPGTWSAGMQGAPDRGQSLGCKRPLPLAGRTFTAHNQPLPSRWLSALPAQLVVAPQATAVITAQLAGTVWVPWRSAPYAAAVRLLTDDPLQPVADLPVSALIDRPPWERWLPWVVR